MKTSERFVGFDVLKSSVTMVQVLERYGLLERLHPSGDSLTGVCPIHTGHNLGQFRVSVSRNCWICFGDCHAGGSIVDFVSRKEGVGIRQAALLIQEWFGVHINGGSQKIERSATPRSSFGAPAKPQEQNNRPLTFALLGLDRGHPYLRTRGLSQETMGTFGLGFCSKGILAGRIAIPVHNLQGRLVAYTGRWPGEPPTGIAKYLFPRGFKKSLELFNLHRALAEDRTQPLVIVEGFFGCMAVWQAGYRRIVALMGSVMSAVQAQLIVKAVEPGESIILLLDGDEAGRKGQALAQESLSKARPVIPVRLMPGQQPDSIPVPELLNLIIQLRRKGLGA